MVKVDPRRMVTHLTKLFVVLAQALLGLRVIFSLLDSDLTNSFIQWVYSTTEVLILPFRGIFPDVSYDNIHVLEFPVLFAMVAYAFAAYVLVAVTYWLPKPPIDSKK